MRAWCAPSHRYKQFRGQVLEDNSISYLIAPAAKVNQVTENGDGMRDQLLRRDVDDLDELSTDADAMARVA